MFTSEHLDQIIKRDTCPLVLHSLVESLQLYLLSSGHIGVRDDVI